MNIVVLRYGGLGDILLATPLLRVLTHRFAGANISFVTESGNVGILANSTLVQSTIGLDKKTRTSVTAHIAKATDIRKQIGKIDLYVNLQPSIKTIAFGFGLFPSKFWTFRKDQRIQTETGKIRHAIDDFLNVIPDGIPVGADRRMEFVITDENRASAERKLSEICPNFSSAIIINPAGTHNINRWPPEKLAQFIEWIDHEMKGYTPVLVGGPGDACLHDAIVGYLGRPIRSLLGKLSLQELGAVMEMSAATVTGDTGPLHIAAAVGARIVCLFGAADPNRTGPSNNPRDLVVINRTLSCIPCRRRSCNRGDIACMTQMSVESVVDALERRIKAG